MLSPILFNIVLNLVMTQAMEKSRGIEWSNGTPLEDLDFHDDLCLLAHSLNDMKEKLEDLKCAAEKVGLKISAQKTKDSGQMIAAPKNLSLGTR